MSSLMYVLEDAQLVILRTYPPPAKIAESEATNKARTNTRPGGRPWRIRHTNMAGRGQSVDSRA